MIERGQLKTNMTNCNQLETSMTHCDQINKHDKLRQIRNRDDKSGKIILLLLYCDFSII